MPSGSDAQRCWLSSRPHTAQARPPRAVTISITNTCLSEGGFEKLTVGPKMCDLNPGLLPLKHFFQPGSAVLLYFMTVFLCFLSSASLQADQRLLPPVALRGVLRTPQGWPPGAQCSAPMPQGQEEHREAGSNRDNALHLRASEHRLRTFCRVPPGGTLLHRHDGTNSAQGWAKTTPLFPKAANLEHEAPTEHFRNTRSPDLSHCHSGHGPHRGSPTGARLTPHRSVLHTAPRQAAHGQPRCLLLDGDQGVGEARLSPPCPWALRGTANECP